MYNYFNELVVINTIIILITICKFYILLIFKLISIINNNHININNI